MDIFIRRINTNSHKVNLFKQMTLNFVTGPASMMYDADGAMLDLRR